MVPPQAALCVSSFLNFAAIANVSTLAWTSLITAAFGCWNHEPPQHNVVHSNELPMQQERSWESYNHHLRRLTTPTAVEYRVNTYTTSLQITPAIAALNDGGYVIVWSSDGQDGGYYGIYGQRYTSSGSRYGDEFRVNTQGVNDQSNAAVTGLADGGYLVVWNCAEEDGSGYGVFSQRYNSANAAVGSNIQVNTYAHNNQFRPAVAALKDGGYIVVWESYQEDDGIYAQRYVEFADWYYEDGSEFHVNTYLSGFQSHPAVTGLEDGGYIVTWHSAGQDGSDDGIYAQRYTSSNAAYGSEFRVNLYTSSDQRYAEVAGLSNGGYVVVWQSRYQDSSDFGIYGRIFNAENVGASTEFLVNTYVSNGQSYPEITAFDTDGFLVTWQSNGQDGSSHGVYAQRFYNSGEKLGAEFQVNTYTNSDQKFPAAAALAGGNMAITWESYPQDGSGTGIYAKLYSSSYFVFTASPTSAPTSPSVAPTAVPTAPPSASPSSTPTSVPTKEPTSVPTAIPSLPFPTCLPSSVPTAMPSVISLNAASAANSDSNLLLIAWSVPVSVVGCIIIVFGITWWNKRRRLLEQELRKKYADTSTIKSNHSFSAVPQSLVLGSDTPDESNGSIQMKTIENSVMEKQNSDETELDDDDDNFDARSSVSSITEAGLSLATPRLPYNLDADEDNMILTLHTPIREGMTSSGACYIVRGDLSNGETDATKTAVVVKLVNVGSIGVVQHELKQLIYIENSVKRLSHRSTIVQPMLSHLVAPDGPCSLRLHTRDSEQIDNWAGLVIESGDDSLQKLLESPLPHHLRLSVLADLLNALHILENCNMVHMDVKPANIVACRLCCKLIDFDASLRRGRQVCADRVWTARYAAPELAKHRLIGGVLYADHKMDMWAFGMVAVEVFCGKDFWTLRGIPDNRIEECLARLTMRDIRMFLDQYIGRDEDAALRSVLLSALVVNPYNRCAASAIMRKSFFNARDSTVVNRRAQITEEIRDTVAHITAKMDDVVSILKSNEEILTTLLTGRYMLPSLFVIVPATKSNSGFSLSIFRKSVMYEYRLYFICPVTKQLAKCGRDGNGYEIRVPKEWLIAVAPAIKFCLCALKIIFSAYGIPPAMIPTLGNNSWNDFGETMRQCMRRDGGDAGEMAFNCLEESFSDITDDSLNSLRTLTSSLQSVTSKSFDQIAKLLQDAEGAPSPVHPSWRPKLTGLVEVMCKADGSTLWVHESVAKQYAQHGKSLLAQLPSV